SLSGFLHTFFVLPHTPPCPSCSLHSTSHFFTFLFLFLLTQTPSAYPPSFWDHPPPTHLSPHFDPTWGVRCVGLACRTMPPQLRDGASMVGVAPWAASPLRRHYCTTSVSLLMSGFKGPKRRTDVTT
ncbi:hypothetical protein AB205_0125430, partial [Aquarana catesbeiana]